MDSIEAFEIAARQVGAVVTRTEAGALEDAISALLQRLGVMQVVVRSNRLHLPGVVRSDSRSADCGITDADWGIASTGTLILPMTEGTERAASLVPPIHIALLPVERIIRGVPEALALVADRYKRSAERLSSVVFVTGPSRTADIELHLVLGVHGPKQLFIYLIG